MSYPIPPQVYTTTNTNPLTINSGSSGQVLYSNITSPTWSDTISISNIQPASVLKVKGDAEFEGDVTLKGKSLSDTLSKLEERLSILHPNEKLEEKWEKLRELRKEYMELEADIIEKEKIWSILKR
jgi:hypothetical protein